MIRTHGFTHVALAARDPEGSAAFYAALEIPTPVDPPAE